MKLNRKFAMISVAALIGVSPILTTSALGNTVQAAEHIVYGNKVKATKTMHAVNSKGKRTGFRIYKNVTYKVWRVKKISGKTYYALESNGKYWIPASATKGKVSYGKKVSSKKTKKTVKKTNKKAVKKTVKKSPKKTNPKKKAKKVSSTKLVTLRRTPIVDKNGKKVKTYMGSKKWTVLGKKVSVIGHGTKQIKGEKYYLLDPHHFVKAADVKAVK